MTTVRISRETIRSMILDSCTSISPDARALLEEARRIETSDEAARMMDCMLENVELAGKAGKPLCQSPGFPTVYVMYGDNADISNLQDDFRSNLVQATKEGFIRPSIVHPLTRANPGDNSGTGVPNFEYQYDHARNDLEVIISFKGCGAELGNIFKTMTTAELRSDISGLKKLVLLTVAEAGGKPCPPTGIGIGIGGQMDVAAKLSREAVSTRNWSDTNPDPLLAELEAELLEKINSLGFGAAGTGGRTYCLAVKINMASTHTAICPVAVNFHCWAARRTGVRVFPNGKMQKLFGAEVNHANI